MAASSASISPSFATATTNDPARANCNAAGIQTTNTTASAGLISSTAAASAVLEPSDPSSQNNTGLFTAQPPVASITQTRVRVLAAGLADVTTRPPCVACVSGSRGREQGEQAQEVAVAPQPQK